ncbi:MAG: glycosyltransferase family 4 protein [Bacteroidales bacterium]|nr:glycosyltransferase family 4 protein [Bacteroidales bacterium]
MKIVYNIDDIHSKGGTQRVTLRKINYLVETYGYDVHIIVNNFYGQSPSFRLNESVKIHHLNYSNLIFGKVIFLLSLIRGIFSFGFNFKKIIDEINPDIIITTNNNPEEILLPFICRNYKTIQEFHYSMAIQKYNLYNVGYFKKIYSYCINIVYKWSFSNYNYFVALTKKDLSEWNLKNGIVISNPIEIPAFKFNNYQKKQAIAVGRFVFQKGFDLLLKIWKTTIHKHHDWKLLICGPGNKIPYMKMAEQMHIKNIEFLDERDNIEDLFYDSSIFLFTSRFEGFGLVLAEAMSIGMAAISFDCPCGPSDMIENNRNGFLIPHENVIDFSDKLNELMSDVGLREKFGHEAYKTIQTFSEEKIMNQWNDLFLSLCN